MARIKPFSAIYYHSRAGDISELVCPPYDVLSPEEANSFRQKNPYNVVHISVSIKGVWDFYLQAKNLFESWQKQNILVRTPKPGIYFYETEFEYFLGGEKRRACRRGFFALLGLADYSLGEVFRHERTLKAPKVDQFNFLSMLQANLSPIFCLYSDPELRLINALLQTRKQEPVLEFEFSGFHHRLFGIYEKELIREVKEALSQEKVYIADGHHRYETALEYYHRLKFARDPLTEYAGYVMSYFCPLEEPGLVIFPYHRLLNHLPKERFHNFWEKLEEDFKIELLSQNFLSREPEKVLEKLETTREERALVLVSEDERAFLLRLKEELVERMKDLLDVEILEDLILKRILKITKEELTENKYISYETSEEKLLMRMKNEKFQLAFLLKPIDPRVMVAKALAGQVMPEKSTYFFPKLPSGMLFRKIEPEPDF